MFSRQPFAISRSKQVLFFALWSVHQTFLWAIKRNIKKILVLQFFFHYKRGPLLFRAGPSTKSRWRLGQKRFSKYFLGLEGIFHAYIYQATKNLNLIFVCTTIQWRVILVFMKFLITAICSLYHLDSCSVWHSSLNFFSLHF